MNWIILTGLLMSGLLFIAIEVFFAPGITLFGLIGSITLLVGVIYAFIYLPFAQALLILGISLVIVFIIVWWMFKYGVRRKFSLKNEEKAANGYQSFTGEYDDLMGQAGIALTDLRPSGKIKIRDRTVQAVTTGAFIEINSEIQVYKVEGNKIIVTLKSEKE